MPTSKDTAPVKAYKGFNADWTILGIQSVPVDGVTILADTYYVLRGGKVVPA